VDRAVDKAKESGVRIFTIGIGTADGSIIPGSGEGESFKKDRQGRAVLSKLDEGLLQKIASATGGSYYRSSRGEVEVESLVREIGRMSQKGFKTEKSIEYEENYQYFLMLGFLLLMAELFLSERRKAL
jgi:Ca-activated chloride channel homolog